MLTQSDPGVAGCETKEEPSTTAGPLVLVVDDESSMQKMLRIVLSANGLRTEEATSGAEALGRAADYNPDLVLLDLGLPDCNGIEVIRQLRAWMTVPILVISARGEEQDKVDVLDAGANDYLTKPFPCGELLARIHVWLRQSARAAPARDESTVEVGELRIDLARRIVSVAGRELQFTPIEYKLFATLIRNPGRVMTHRQLLETTWGPRHGDDTQYLRVYMGRLRRKLEPGATTPRYIVTEPGVGYRLRAD